MSCDDAPYIYRLRSNPEYSEYLSEVRGQVADQVTWIQAYKHREARGKELYYLIQRNDGKNCGLVRLYEIGEEAFRWGSWILDKSKPRKAALESAVLSFGVGFELLGLKVALVDVSASNARAESFYRRFNMREVERTAREIHFSYSREQYDLDKQSHLAVCRKIQ